MRELTLEELELVAGGDDTGDIVVTGDRGGDSGDWGDWGDFGDYGDTGGGDSGVGGGDSGADTPPADFHGISATGESVQPFLNQPHMNPGDSRPLTQNEKIALAGYTNLTAAQIDAIRINAGGQFGSAAATTWSGTNISFDPQFALQDFSKNADTMDLLVHEAYHVYQYDSGLGYLRMAADEIAVGTSSHDYYTYTQQDLAAIAQNPSALAAMNIETQAAIAQDFYRVSNGLAAQGAVGFSPSAADLGAASHLR